MSDKLENINKYIITGEQLEFLSESPYSPSPAKNRVADIVRSRTLSDELQKEREKIRAIFHEKMLTKDPIRAKAFCDAVDIIDLLQGTPQPSNEEIFKRSLEVMASPGWQKQHDAAIAEQERERIIKKLEHREELSYFLYHAGSPEMREMGKIRCEEIEGIIESLRGAT